MYNDRDNLKNVYDDSYYETINNEYKIQINKEKKK